MDDMYNLDGYRFGHFVQGEVRKNFSIGTMESIVGTQYIASLQ